MSYLQQTLKPSFIYRLNISVVFMSNENVREGHFYYLIYLTLTALERYPRKENTRRKGNEYRYCNCTTVLQKYSSTVFIGKVFYDIPGQNGGLSKLTSSV